MAKAQLRQEVLDIVRDLVEQGTVTRADADTFLSAGLVQALVEVELRKRERQRRAALSWWRRAITP